MQTLERDVGQIDRCAFARRRGGTTFAMHLDRARPASIATRHHLHLGVRRHFTAVSRSGDDGTEAFHRESAIDRKAKDPGRRIAVGDLCDRVENGATEVVESGEKLVARPSAYLIAHDKIIKE